MKATYHKHTLLFKKPGGTSRGVMTHKESWFLLLKEENKVGIGECGLLRGLSPDDEGSYKSTLQWVCRELVQGRKDLFPELQEYPSISFGLEQALASLAAEDPYLLFPSEFTAGQESIPINGLVWMGSRDDMLRQVREKVDSGFQCVKLKIGALDFETELAVLKEIRKDYPANVMELRVDANGAFTPAEALEKLKRLSDYELHSIEQPIARNQWEEMAALCAGTPLPIALDEELIGIASVTQKEKLLQTIQPDYLILKPSLMGGYRGCDSWIATARKHQVGWWITSALESNIGLNAIAQWTFCKGPEIAQGLGTGGLFTNNFASPLQVADGCLSYRPEAGWTNPLMKNLCI